MQFKMVAPKRSYRAAVNKLSDTNFKISGNLPLKVSTQHKSGFLCQTHIYLFFIHTRVYAARQRLVTSCGSRGGSVQFAIENEAGLNIMPKALESRRYFDRKCFYRRMRFFIHQACCAAILRQYIPTLHRMAHASLVNEKTHPPIKILTVEISPRALGMM